MTDSKKTDEDVLVLGPDLGENHHPFYRKNSSGIQAGIMRPVKEGETLTEDALFIEHQGPGPVYKVTPVFEKSSRSKPATADYRDGWNRIFGGKAHVGSA